jgi:cytochrome b subunit of formate dehydrogenase
MSKPVRMSIAARKNWIVDASVFLGGILAALSGIYFLFSPSGGYQGGRNPTYGLTVLWSRHSWSDLHTWTGVLMIAAVVVHLAIHWQWVKRTSRRTITALMAGGKPLSRGAMGNLAVDALIAISFLICAGSGIYLLFSPSGGLHGGRYLTSDSGLLFARTTWDLIHTWSGVVLIVAATIHFAIHWRWVRSVTTRFFLSLRPQPRLRGIAAAE